MAITIATSSGARIPLHLAAQVPARTIKPGSRVMARDRDNFGKVCSVDEYRGTALVHFRRNYDGSEAYVRLPLAMLIAQ